MSVTTPRRSRKSPKRRRSAPTARAAARRRFEATFRPLVERWVTEAIEDRLDALDGLEALRESGEVAHDEFWKRRGL